MRCLASIVAHPPPEPFDVWVVDNASQDGSAEAMRNRFPQVRVLENRENLGFAQASNLAIRQSKASSVLLLNPDTEVKQGTLAALVRLMEENPQIGAVGGSLLNSDGTHQPSFYAQPTLAREFWRLFYLDRLRSEPTYASGDIGDQNGVEVDGVMGACMLLRRAALDEVGLLDDDYFMYSEEVDLCHRLRKAGWNIYYAPHAEVVHHGGQSTRLVPTEMFLQLYRGKILYFRKNHGRLAAFTYKLILLLASVPRVLASPLARNERSPLGTRPLTLASRYWRLLQSLPSM